MNSLDARLELYSLLGQKVGAQNIGDGTVEIMLSVKSGTYFYTIKQCGMLDYGIVHID